MTTTRNVAMSHSCRREAAQQLRQHDNSTGVLESAGAEVVGAAVNATEMATEAALATSKESADPPGGASHMMFSGIPLQGLLAILLLAICKTSGEGGGG
jgi:hypothetical protein